MAKNIVTFESYCDRQGWEPCGLNAVWAVEAYCIKGEAPYGLVALDMEDGTYAVVYSISDEVVEHFVGSFEHFVRFCEQLFTPVLTA